LLLQDGFGQNFNLVHLLWSINDDVAIHNLYFIDLPQHRILREQRSMLL
jgi:hypothetical protein